MCTCIVEHFIPIKKLTTAVKYLDNKQLHVAGTSEQNKFLNFKKFIYLQGKHTVTKVYTRNNCQVLGLS